ncbi:hypothetical protein OPIT5_12100 [Opitutaceae bacterium TAV5]|nr:hypothetical protein OPIT5_12100 [Opitutaceae bacterium TAV5]
MPDDAALLCRYAETRAEDAFAELVRRHLAFVYSAALRRTGGDAHRAEDVTQIVFTDLARKARALSRHPTLAGWLHTSTRYAAASVTRSEYRRQHREQEASAMADNDTATTPHTLHPAIADSASATDADWQQLRPVIDATLDRLDARDREIILLRFFGNHTFAAIGEKLRLTDDAVRKRADRALEKLRRHLARRGITSTASALGLAFTTHATVATPASLAAGVTNAALSAATATTATTAATLVPLALMTKLKTGALGLALAAAVTTAGSATLAIVVTQQHAQLTRLRAAIAAADPELPRLRARLDAAERDRDAALRKLAEARSARATPPPPPPPVRTLADKFSAEGKALDANPEYAAFQRRQSRLSVQKDYGNFFDQLDLDRETRDRLKEILADSRDEVVRSAKEAGYQGRSLPDAERREILSVFDEKIREVLGDAAFDALEEYRIINGVSGYGDSLAAKNIGLALADAGQPVDPGQQARISRYIYEEIYAKKPPAPDSLAGALAEAAATTGGLSADEHAVLARAAADALLTPAQRELIRRYFADEREYRLLIWKTRESLSPSP